VVIRMSSTVLILYGSAQLGRWLVCLFMISPGIGLVND
jgi:hypothetical protein